MDSLCQLKVVNANTCQFYFCIQLGTGKLMQFFLRVANMELIPAAKQGGMTALKKEKLKDVHDSGTACAFLSAA